MIPEACQTLHEGVHSQLDQLVFAPSLQKKSWVDLTYRLGC